MLLIFRDNPVAGNARLPCSWTHVERSWRLYNGCSAVNYSLGDGDAMPPANPCSILFAALYLSGWLCTYIPCSRCRLDSFICLLPKRHAVHASR